MKKILALALALAMLFCITACGSNDKDDEKKSPADKWLAEYEELVDDYINAVKDGDLEKAMEIAEKAEELQEEYEEIADELEEEDEDAYDEFVEKKEELDNKVEEFMDNYSEH